MKCMVEKSHWKVMFSKRKRKGCQEERENDEDEEKGRTDLLLRISQLDLSMASMNPIWPTIHRSVT